MNNYNKIIGELIQINRLTGAPELTRTVVSLLESKEKRIYIAVLGQFKSGKSSLINNLTGLNLLPVGVVPVTAIVTRLEYGPHERLIIRYTDNKEVVTNLADLPMYVTEKHNPENVKKVAIAIVQHPVMKQFKNICLVDTPGLSSFYKHNSEATMQWLPYTGAALIAISAERPLAEEDINLIRGTLIHCPNVFILVTKTDLFNQEELSEIKEHILSSVENAIGHELPLIEYSVYKNPGKHLNEVLETIIKPFNQLFRQRFEDIIRYKIKTCAEQSLKYAELVLQAALKRESEKDAISKALVEINLSKHHHEREMQLSCISFKGEIRPMLESIILPYQGYIEQRLFTKFSAYYSWKGSLSTISRRFEQWLKTNLEAEITFVDDICFDQINSLLIEPASYFEYSALLFRQRLIEKLDQLFGVILPDVSWQIEFTGIDKPDISVSRTFESHLDMILFFMPMNLFRGLFYKHFQKQIVYEVNKNLQRYLSVLTGKIIKSIDKIHRQATRFINNEQKEIEQILSNDKSNYNDVQRCIEDLWNIQEELSISRM